jgi:hypothetical protein
MTWDNNKRTTKKKEMSSHIYGKKVLECLYRRHARIITKRSDDGEISDDEDSDEELEEDEIGAMENAVEELQIAENSSQAIGEARRRHTLASTQGVFDATAFGQAEREQAFFECYVLALHPKTLEGIMIAKMHSELTLVESGQKTIESISQAFVAMEKVHVSNVKSVIGGHQLAVGVQVRAYPRQEQMSLRDQESDFVVHGTVTSTLGIESNEVGVQFAVTLLPPRQEIVLGFMHERLKASDDTIDIKHYPSALKALWAIRNITRKAGLQVCKPANSLNDLMKKMKEDHRAHPAPAFDLVDHGQMLYESSKTAWPRPLDSLMYWTMFLLMMACILRASEVTTYCPNIHTIRLPEKEEECERGSGLPNFSYFKTKTRKGTAATRPYTMRVHRNKCTTAFCPVFHLCAYLTAADLWHESGPIFRKIHGIHGSEHVKYGLTYRDEDGAWIDSDSKQDERILVDSWRKSLKLLFNNVLDELIQTCSSHSVRRSAVKWASRCQAPTWQILNAGRWMEYTLSFLLYIQSGARDAEVYAADPASDPIYSIWTWVPVTQDTAINAELSGALQQSTRQAHATERS